MAASSLAYNLAVHQDAQKSTKVSMLAGALAGAACLSVGLFLRSAACMTNADWCSDHQLSLTQLYAVQVPSATVFVNSKTGMTLKLKRKSSKLRATKNNVAKEMRDKAAKAAITGLLSMATVANPTYATEDSTLTDLMKAWNEEYGAEYGQWDMTANQFVAKRAAPAIVMKAPDVLVTRKVAAAMNPVEQVVAEWNKDYGTTYGLWQAVPTTESQIDKVPAGQEVVWAMDLASTTAAETEVALSEGYTAAMTVDRGIEGSELQAEVASAGDGMISEALPGSSLAAMMPSVVAFVGFVATAAGLAFAAAWQSSRGRRHSYAQVGSAPTESTLILQRPALTMGDRQQMARSPTVEGQRELVVSVSPAVVSSTANEEPAPGEYVFSWATDGMQLQYANKEEPVNVIPKPVPKRPVILAPVMKRTNSKRQSWTDVAARSLSPRPMGLAAAMAVTLGYKDPMPPSEPQEYMFACTEEGQMQLMYGPPATDDATH